MTNQLAYQNHSVNWGCIKSCNSVPGGNFYSFNTAVFDKISWETALSKTPYLLHSGRPLHKPLKRTNLFTTRCVTKGKKLYNINTCSFFFLLRSRNRKKGKKNLSIYFVGGTTEG